MYDWVRELLGTKMSIAQGGKEYWEKVKELKVQEEQGLGQLQ